LGAERLSRLVRWKFRNAWAPTQLLGDLLAFVEPP
jgi:hypothetical protein